MRASSSCGEWVLLFIAEDKLLIETAFVSEQGLQYKQSIDGSGSLIHKSARKSQVMEQHGVSIKVVSLRADTTMPRSIVRVHSTHMKEDTPEKLNIQARRVTWAL
ncbi:hypothetical protein MG293_019747 [Ovis ammon polii]|uniref:Uncharacterized protein n=1 Tax=Ovis ammon polii TaxID=230172 RepID=A0AAD4TNN7_OVIAM|nr:hypothetical protein MG293_019747 [Ovis ammon polii]